VTALVDVETLYIIDVHLTTSKTSDFLLGSQIARRDAGDLLSLAADKDTTRKPFVMSFVPTESGRLSTTGGSRRLITPTTPA